MTVNFTCYGNYDDLCEIVGDFFYRYKLSAFKEDYKYLRINRKDNSKDGFIVVYHYEDNGCWSVAPMMLDEDTPIPDWASFKFGRGYYTMALDCTLSGEIDEYEYVWLKDISVRGRNE